MHMYIFAISLVTAYELLIEIKIMILGFSVIIRLTIFSAEYTETILMSKIEGGIHLLFFNFQVSVKFLYHSFIHFSS